MTACWYWVVSFIGVTMCFWIINKNFVVKGELVISRGRRFIFFVIIGGIYATSTTVQLLFNKYQRIVVGNVPSLRVNFYQQLNHSKNIANTFPKITP